jgi:hypothetical protein
VSSQSFGTDANHMPIKVPLAYGEKARGTGTVGKIKLDATSD